MRFLTCLSFCCFFWSISSTHAQESILEGSKLDLPLEQQLYMDGYSACYTHKNRWNEATAFYSFDKRNSEKTRDLFGSLGLRTDRLQLDHHHLHPSSYQNLLASIGSEKQYAQWLWQWNLEGLFQAPTFNPITSTRYSFELFGSHQFTNHLSAQFGAGVRFGMLPVGFPIIGVLYLKNRWRLELLFPNMAAASYQVNATNNLGLYIQNKTRVFRAHRAYGHDDALINFQTVFAELRWKHFFSQKVSLWLSLGWNLFTRVKVGDRFYHHERQIFQSSRGLVGTLGLQTKL